MTMRAVRGNGTESRLEGSPQSGELAATGFRRATVVSCEYVRARPDG